MSNTANICSTCGAYYTKEDNGYVSCNCPSQKITEQQKYNKHLQQLRYSNIFIQYPIELAEHKQKPEQPRPKCECHECTQARRGQI